MWSKLKAWIYKLFGKKIPSDTELAKDELDAKQYLDIHSENITAIISNALSILTFGDADLIIDPSDGALQEILSDVLNQEFIKAKRNVSCCLGVGMIASIPYCVDNGLGRKIYIDTVTKDRFFITGMQGTDIVQAVALSEVREIDRNIYTRWVEYEINNGDYIIRNKCMKDGVEYPLDVIPDWQNITPEITIRGVEKLPIGVMKCPTGARRPDDVNGVPITFGCKPTIDKIMRTLNDIEVEFKRKKAKVFADRTLLKPTYDANGNLVSQDFDDDLFVKFGSSDNFTTEIFDPAFRETSYYAKLDNHFEFLEKEIGLSKGILTELNTAGATATEIKRSTYQTFCLVDDIRKAYEQYLIDLAYGIEVLAGAYGMATHSDYDITVDWSYAMLEDSQETFNQLTQGVSMGAVKPEEVRMYVFPNESIEEATEVVEGLKTSNPSLEKLLAGSEE